MNAYNSTLNIYLHNGDQSSSSEPIILLSVPDPNDKALTSVRKDYHPYDVQDDISEYRPGDFSAVTKLSKITKFEFVCIFSSRQQNKTESIISICRTIFISFVLGLSSYYFIKDANRLVLYPIERILTKLKFIAKNP